MRRYLSVILQPELVGCLIVSLLCGMSILVSPDREMLPSNVYQRGVDIAVVPAS